MKKFGFLIAAVVFAAVAGAVAYGVYFMANKQLDAEKPISSAAVRCDKAGVKHAVSIKDDKMVPEHTAAALCDTLTITNNDNRIRLIAFGPHEQHEPYDGVTTKVLGPDQSFTITLNQTGTYSFHDHLQDETSGQFVVTR